MALPGVTLAQSLLVIYQQCDFGQVMHSVYLFLSSVPIIVGQATLFFNWSSSLRFPIFLPPNSVLLTVISTRLEVYGADSQLFEVTKLC